MTKGTGKLFGSVVRTCPGAAIGTLLVGAGPLSSRPVVIEYICPEGPMPTGEPFQPFPYWTPTGTTIASWPPDGYGLLGAPPSICQFPCWFSISGPTKFCIIGYWAGGPPPAPEPGANPWLCCMLLRNCAQSGSQRNCWARREEEIGGTEGGNRGLTGMH